MYNFEPYNVLLSISTNIPVLFMTASVLQGHIYKSENHSSTHTSFSLLFLHPKNNVSELSSDTELILYH